MNNNGKNFACYEGIPRHILSEKLICPLNNNVIHGIFLPRSSLVNRLAHKLEHFNVNLTFYLRSTLELSDFFWGLYVAAVRKNIK